jgi:hypothetical protein
MKKHHRHGGSRDDSGRKLKYEHLGQNKPARVTKIPGDITDQEIDQWIQAKLIEKYGLICNTNIA